MQIPASPCGTVRASRISARGKTGIPRIPLKAIGSKGGPAQPWSIALSTVSLALFRTVSNGSSRPASSRTDVFDQRDVYKRQLLYVGDGTKAGRLAVEGDVQAGTTPAPGGKQIPLALSRAAAGQGLRALYRGPQQVYLDATLHEYLKRSVYDGDQLRDIYELPFLFGFLSLLVQLPFSITKDIKRRKELKYGRLLKGCLLYTSRCV